MEELVLKIKVQCGPVVYYRGLNIPVDRFDDEPVTVAWNSAHATIENYVNNGCWVQDNHNRNRFLSRRAIAHITILEGEFK
jgi:hypothetical protein